MSFMTPPFAGSIFYLRGSVVPLSGASKADIIKSVWPFVFCITSRLLLCITFPQSFLWPAGKMIA